MRFLRGKEYRTVVFDFVDLAGSLGGVHDGNILDGDGVAKTFVFAVYTLSAKLPSGISFCFWSV